MRQMNKHEQAAVFPRTKFKDVPRDIAVDYKIVSALMAGAWKVKIVESPDYSEIKEIRIFY